MNQIERMSRFRKNLLKGILWGSGIWTGILVIWIGIVFNRLISQTSYIFKIIIPVLQYAGYASVLVVLFFLFRYWRHKWNLKKDPQLRSALNDERLRLSWFKAYRFSFFTVVVLHVILLLNQAIPNMIFHKQGVFLPQFAEIPLTLLLAVLSCVGAFLHYSREE
jgi:hypothetical protein